jgi:hypothetical protein
MSIVGIANSVSVYRSTANISRGVQSTAETGQSTQKTAKQTTPDEERQIQKLKERDRQVRQHEQAHMAAGSGLVTSSASFTYQRGPDGEIGRAHV